MTQAAPKRALPGDFTSTGPLAAALRIDHAGEYGATRIYAGQLAVLKHHSCGPELSHMAQQEKVHLDTFTTLLPHYQVRPTALLPLWHVGGWLMGAVTAAISPRAAMACTVAVEEVITEHYNDQLQSGMLDADLSRTIAQFRDEEMEHHTIGLEHEAEAAPMYGPITGIIRRICRAAIWASARI